MTVRSEIAELTEGLEPRCITFCGIDIEDMTREELIRLIRWTDASLTVNETDDSRALFGARLDYINPTHWMTLPVARKGKG